MIYEWTDAGDKEMFELTTKAIQYHYHADGSWFNTTTGDVYTLTNKRWVAEIRKNGKWKVIGLYLTGKSARKAAEQAFESLAATEDKNDKQNK